MKKYAPLLFIFAVTLITFSATPIKPVFACCIPTCTTCAPLIGACQTHCTCVSDAEMGTSDKPKTTMGHITDEFKKHRKWMVDLFFNDEKPNDPPGLRGAMKLMTSQLVSIGVQQVQIIGAFFDAKHQLETQRLFQQLTARAHKDYHPSEELCEFGTVTRSLSASFRNTDLTAAALSKHSTDRQVLSTYVVGGKNSKGRVVITDKSTRLVQFIKKYCNKKDDAGNLDYLCKKGGNKPELFNKDINFTTTIDSPLTLDLDFSKKGKDITEDESAIFALMANLFSHSLFPFVSDNKFVTPDGEPDYEAAGKAYIDARALMAKRSVASNSLASIAALKAKGDKEAQPFIYSLIKEMGGDKMTVDQIKNYIGDEPSYYAQMEVLTKKLYQTPNFYTELYDKPANVARKDVAIQAATLMQKRDLYRSYLRSEMVLAVMLEASLVDEQDRIKNEIKNAKVNLIGRKIP